MYAPGVQVYSSAGGRKNEVLDCRDYMLLSRDSTDEWVQIVASDGLGTCFIKSDEAIFTVRDLPPITGYNAWSDMCTAAAATATIATMTTTTTTPGTTTAASVGITIGLPTSDTAPSSSASTVPYEMPEEPPMEECTVYREQRAEKIAVALAAISGAVARGYLWGILRGRKSR